MNSTNNKVVHLIKEYQKTVRAAILLLNKKYEKEPNFHEVNENDDKQIRQGFLDNEEKIRYKFHGVNGCIVQWAAGRYVDFNLGRGGRADRFNLGFVHAFFEENKDINQH